jgi:hypothetical protein
VTEALKAIRGPLFGLFLAAVGKPRARREAYWGARAACRHTSITNILLSPDFQRLRAELVGVLARYPEAQAEVAAVFRQSGLRAAIEMGASAEEMIEVLPVGAEHAT